jgi:hypothetical protein
MLLIKILLGIAAAYSGGMYAVQFIGFFRHYEAFQLEPGAAEAMERHTFHLGLCFILAVGFLGLLLNHGG